MVDCKKKLPLHSSLSFSSRLVKAEEKQQLAMLYENIEIPLIDEKEASKDDSYSASSQLHPEDEELGKFIGSGAFSYHI